MRSIIRPLHHSSRLVGATALIFLFDGRSGTSRSRTLPNPWRVTWLGLATWLLIAGSPGVAASEAPGYVGELPTPEQIMQHFQGEDLEQTLGRQCAALDMLARGNRLFPFADLQQPAMLAAQQRYRDAIQKLTQRYAREVRALDSEEAKRRWNVRLCGNYPHAVHPITGERDDSFPGLKQPVKVDEVVALFGPAAQAAHASMRSEMSKVRQRSQAEKKAAEEYEAGRTAREIKELLALGADMLVAFSWVFGLILASWALLRAWRRDWSFDPARGELRVGDKVLKLSTLDGRLAGDPRPRAVEYYFARSVGPATPYAPMNIHFTKHTVHYVAFTLRTPEGGTHDFDLRGWQLPSRAGNVLLMAWLQNARGRRIEPVALIHDLTQGQGWYDLELLQRQLVPMHLLVWLGVIVVATYLFFPALLVMVPATFWIERRSRRQAAELGQTLRHWAAQHTLVEAS
jgi:hypothetical protein